ncbi:MAG: hypothetical protein LBF77_02405, partial [Spirochaetaceae bacterium]|nr:hypothetical protein [Spirochaetaceae bacterium]
DFIEWLKPWGILIGFTLKAPVKVFKSFFECRWMPSYLAAPAFVDSQSQGQRGVMHKICRKEFRHHQDGYHLYRHYISISYQLMPVFLVSEIDLFSAIPYIDAIESFGLPLETCPVPSSEA